MFIRKAVLICNSCKREIEVDPDNKDPLMSVSFREGTALEGWEHIKDDIDLCPKCAAAYNSKKKEYEAELNKFLGTHIGCVGL